MLDFNSIVVTTANCLEVGDTVAMELIGGVVSGKIEGVAHFPFQLTEDQRAYMQAHNLPVPENQYAELAGQGSRLIFGKFYGFGLNIEAADGLAEHMYVSDSTTVAVFLNANRS